MERPPPRGAEVTWRDGDVPVSTRYGEAYYGSADALAEKRHVFIEGNGLPGRFRTRLDPAFSLLPMIRFHIAEFGFGTGLNALAAARAWQAAGCHDTLRYTAFEAHPLPAADMARALRPWPELAVLAGQLVEQWAAGARILALYDPKASPRAGGAIEIEVIEGDARETLPRWQGKADAWFLDGFSPARNPELWEPALIRALGARSARWSTLATYSAAAHLRDALRAEGWTVKRAPGFGRKRHMTQAHWSKSLNFPAGAMRMSPPLTLE